MKDHGNENSIGYSIHFHFVDVLSCLLIFICISWRTVALYVWNQSQRLLILTLSMYILTYSVSLVNSAIELIKSTPCMSTVMQEACQFFFFIFLIAHKRGIWLKYIRLKVSKLYKLNNPPSNMCLYHRLSHVTWNCEWFIKLVMIILLIAPQFIWISVVIPERIHAYNCRTFKQSMHWSEPE